MAGHDFADDAVLVKALTARDRDAFAYLLNRYHASLVRLARQYVPGRAVAEEVVQETWLAVIQGIDRFEQRSSLKTWVLSILVNVARSHGVKENRSIPFATTAVITDVPAVDSHRFRRFGRGRGQWKRPPHAWSDPELVTYRSMRGARVERRESTCAAPPGTVDGPRRARAQVRRKQGIMSAAAPYVCRQFVEDITAYLDGALPDDVTVVVELHLADCPHCREYLRQMRRTIAMTQALTEDDVNAMPTDVRERLLRAFQEHDE